MQVAYRLDETPSKTKVNLKSHPTPAIPAEQIVVSLWYVFRVTSTAAVSAHLSCTMNSYSGYGNKITAKISAIQSLV